MDDSNFRKMKVWQRARVLARNVYRETQAFPRAEMFGLTQQMRRAAISILSNIAEGQGRWGRKEARNFALIARGSAVELEAQLVIASDLGYLTSETAEKLIRAAIEVNRMLNGLINHFERMQ